MWGLNKICLQHLVFDLQANSIYNFRNISNITLYSFLSMNPLKIYQQAIENQAISPDAQQQEIIKKLDHIYWELVKNSQILARAKAKLYKPKLVRGLYLWGSVGSGKTFLVDLFYQALPFKNKLRMHFHQFMRLVHQQLTVLQGKRDPLKMIAKKLAAQGRVLCLDELMVTDITDAMLLGRLFQAIFSQGICLIVTTNIAPDDLYKNGIQRTQFLPAIALLKQHTQIVHLTLQHDYRLRHEEHLPHFIVNEDPEIAMSYLQTWFEKFSAGAVVSEQDLHIYGRTISVIKQAGGVVWFDFFAICGIPRYHKDYLRIAEQFHTVLISHVPALSPKQDNLVRSFIHLVDVFYDAKIRLIISAAVPLEELYKEGRETFEFARTYSRLLEMQSLTWQEGL